MRALRAGLAALAGLQLVLGLWTQWGPSSFYATVPTVDLTPPYSEHFVRDFGGATVASGVVLAAAAWWLERRLTIVALASYLIFSIPHTVFHLGHLRGAAVTEQVALTVGLSATVVGPVLLLVLAIRRLPARPGEPRSAPA